MMIAASDTHCGMNISSDGPISMSSLPYFTNRVGNYRPKIAVVLGSGQGSVLSAMTELASIHFAGVPGLVAPTVAGHSGKIVLGALAGQPILVFHGRLHFYEGHSWERVGAPIRFAADLGVKTLLLTNAAGGIHSSLSPGSLMIIGNHLSWQRPSSWHGSDPGPSGCVLDNRPSPYSPKLIERLHEAGREVGENLMTGIYAAVTGPCYETPREIRALQKAGADAVGMSTAHEVETGAELGLECAAISGITNKGAGLTHDALDHNDVLHVMSQLRDRLGRLIAAFIRKSD
jgi:purine-nucleoside phosphorylase